MHDRIDIKSPGRKSFVRTVIYSDKGAMIVPLIFSCSGSNRKAADNKGNLLANCDFEQVDPSNSNKSGGWEIGRQVTGKAVTIAGDKIHSGSQALLQLRTALDNESPPFSFGGDSSPVFERKDFVEGQIGKALGEKAEGWSFNVSGSIFPDAGTFSVWMKPAAIKDKAFLRVLGHAWPFIGIYSNGIVACNQPYNYAFGERIGEWLHIAMRWDLKELAYFIDGQNVLRAKRENYEIPTGELWGLSQDVAAFDDIRIYSTPLNSSEIKSLY